mmetsp:Transcript_2780/g.5716  ORF Transcript_2780/g.5716 Transcript_2780/m.5716 type:complete len:248 (+) Transcript_2780:396-1139(+)
MLAKDVLETLRLRLGVRGIQQGGLDAKPGQRALKCGVSHGRHCVGDAGVGRPSQAQSQPQIKSIGGEPSVNMDVCVVLHMGGRRLVLVPCVEYADRAPSRYDCGRRLTPLFLALSLSSQLHPPHPPLGLRPTHNDSHSHSHLHTIHAALGNQLGELLGDDTSLRVSEFCPRVREHSPSFQQTGAGAVGSRAFHDTHGFWVSIDRHGGLGVSAHQCVPRACHVAPSRGVVHHDLLFLCACRARRPIRR